MAFEKAKQYLEEHGFGDRIKTFDVSSATVELAAVAVGTEPEKIVKSLTFMVDGAPVLILRAGDTKIAYSKFKQFFHVKATMLTRDEVHEMVGHDVGGVCPFGINDGVKVYLDESLKRFDTVQPGCGSDNSTVKLSIKELEEVSGCIEWIDVCQIREKE